MTDSFNKHELITNVWLHGGKLDFHIYFYIHNVVTYYFG